MLADALARHARSVLLFSGGKDSLACLELARPYLDRITVLWVNTGSVFPEIAELMARVRADVPHFQEVRSDVAKYIAANGVPVDVVPVNATLLGRVSQGTSGLLAASYLDCCATNLWRPTVEAIRQIGATAVIRGQRGDDARRAPAVNGQVVDGIEYLHPLEGWSAIDVRNFLEGRGIAIDERLRLAHSSLDCRVCTAYLDDTADRLDYLKAKHPEDARYVINVVQMIGSILHQDMQPMIRLLEGEQ